MEEKKSYVLYAMANEEGATDMERENYWTLRQIYDLASDDVPEIFVYDYKTKQDYYLLANILKFYFAEAMKLRKLNHESNSGFAFFYDTYAPYYSERITYTEEEAEKLKSMDLRSLGAQEKWIWTCIDFLHAVVKNVTKPALRAYDDTQTSVTVYQMSGFSFNTDIPTDELQISDKAMFLEPAMNMPGSWTLHELCADNFFTYVLPELYLRISSMEQRGQLTTEEKAECLDISQYYIGLA